MNLIISTTTLWFNLVRLSKISKTNAYCFTMKIEPI